MAVIIDVHSNINSLFRTVLMWKPFLFIVVGLMFAGMPVGDLRQQPLWFRARCTRADQMPAAFHLRAEQFELQMTLLQLCIDVLPGRPDTGIEQRDMAGPILSRCDDTFEVRVVERVVFDFSGESFDGRIETRTFRHRPTAQHVADLQAEVIVTVARVVQLHDEDRTALLPSRRRTGRLGGFLESALAPIFGERRSHVFRRDGASRPPALRSPSVLPAHAWSQLVCASLLAPPIFSPVSVSCLPGSSRAAP